MHVIGIGASAGGLEAIRSFFEEINAFPNASFVIIQHLSPDFKSLMGELLKDHTPLTITTAYDHEKVQANTIYLIPQGKVMEIHAGELWVHDKDPNIAIHYPIDTFFHSLAQSYQDKAIGIILSGTGSDGTRGLKSIKEEGGIVMVQDPESSQFDGMPNSAISTGLVDILGTPEELASQTVQIVRQEPSSGNHTYLERPITTRGLNNILHTILIKTGLDFQYYKKSTLARRLTKRIRVNNLNTIEDYYDYLLSHEVEVESLAKDMLIGVTQFFRNPEAYEIIKKEVIPALFSEKNPSEDIRIWSIGCSTGEEAYSLALLLEDYRHEHKIQQGYKIFATDLDKEAINRASLGSYVESIFVDIPPEFLERYFIRRNERYEVKKTIRDNIVFASHNVLKDPPFINLDFISCRNLLIYFEPKMQISVLDKLQYSLNKGGYLFLGISEYLKKNLEDYEIINNKWRIFRNNRSDKLPVTEWQHKTFTPLDRKRVQEPIKRPKERIIANPLAESYATVLLDHYAPQCLLVDLELEVLHMAGKMGNYLKMPASRNQFNLEYMVNREQSAIFRSGIRKASSSNSPYLVKEVPLSRNGQAQLMNLRFTPVWSEELQDKYFVIEFEENTQAELAKDVELIEVFSRDKYAQQQIESLQLELKETKYRLKMAIERYETTSEELQTTNEELMSSNEEMQSTNEELQSVNEELHTVNTELQSKIEELTNVNNDVNNLLTSSDIGTIFLDRDLRIRKFTPAVEKQFNLVNTDIGRPIFDFSSNFGFEQFRKDLLEVLNEGASHQFEIEQQEGLHYLMKFNPFINKKREIDGLVISFVDISASKKAQKALEVSEGNYKKLYNNTPALLYSINPEGKITSVSNYWLEYMGYQRSEVLNRHFYDFVSGEFRPESQNNHGEPFFVSGKAEHLPFQFVKKSGEIMDTLLSAISESDESGKATRALAILTDITGLKRAENALIESESRFRNLVDSSPVLIWMLDQDMKIVHLNKTWEQFRGHELSKQLGQEWFAWLHEEDQEATRTLMEEAYAQRVPFENLSRIHRSDLAFRWLITRGVPFHNREGEFQGYIGSSLDITENKINQEKLERYNRELEQFAYVATHDLRSPIVNLKTLVQFFYRKGLVNSDNEEVIDRIAQSVDIIHDTLDDLIYIVASKKALDDKVSQVHFETLAQNIMHDINGQIEKFQAQITFDFSRAPQINSVPSHLKSIVSNLLMNACKYRHPDRPPVIYIYTESVEAYICFTIRDNGRGIKPENYEKIFGMFQRLDDDVEGKGIGLYVTRSQVEALGGYVEVNSEYGQGTTFQVYLPREFKPTLETTS